MSHITTIKTKFANLEAVELAARECGVELRRNQKTFLAFAGEKHPCDAAVCVPEAIAKTLDRPPYELGLVKQADGSYEARIDNWQGGYGLNARIGNDACKLQQLYGIHAATLAARRQGMNVTRQNQQDGSIRLICEPKPVYAQAGAGWAGSGY